MMLHNLFNRWVLVSLLCLVAMGNHLAAHAESKIMITPIDPSLVGTETATGVWLENQGNQPVSLQVRVFTWEQKEFSDRYTEQSRVIASPPITKIEPGKRQMIRLVNTEPAPPNTQLTFRVIIDELPETQQLTAPPNTTSLGLRFQMRYSIPFFIYGPSLWIYDPVRSSGSGEPALPELSYSVTQEGKQKFLIIHNDGPVHARLASTQLITKNEKKITITEGLLGYVLAGQSMRWPIPEAAPTQGFRLQSTVNNEIDPMTINVK